MFELEAELRQRVEAHAERVDAERNARRAKYEIRSRRDAKPMWKDDVCNVRRLKMSEQELLIRRLELCNPKLTRNLLAADEPLRGDG